MAAVKEELTQQEEKPRNRTRSIHIPIDLEQTIQEIASQEERSFNGQVRIMLTQWLLDKRAKKEN